MEKVLVGAIRREMAVEDQCAKQAAEIAQLNRLVGILFFHLSVSELVNICCTLLIIMTFAGPTI